MEEGAWGREHRAWRMAGRAEVKGVGRLEDEKKVGSLEGEKVGG